MALNLFKKKKLDPEKVIELNIEEPVNCLCDFTYNFYWSHKGEEMELEDIIPGTKYSFKNINDLLRENYTIKINGDVGHRLASSAGVDLKFFGGTGQNIPIGDIIVDGNVDTRMGISLTRGSIYVSGEIKEPIGNLLEIKSDLKGYRKFKSITDILTNGTNGEKIIGAELYSNKLEINDGLVRDTIGTRLDVNYEITVNGDVDLSTGVLMKKGLVRVNGNAGKNTAALLNGGTVIINGSCDDFAAVDMLGGVLIVNGNAGTFMAANRKSGVIYAKKASAIYPTKEHKLNNEDKNILLNTGFNSKGFSRFE